MPVLTCVQEFRSSCNVHWVLSMGIMNRRPKGILTYVPGFKFHVAFYNISNLGSDT